MPKSKTIRSSALEGVDRAKDRAGELAADLADRIGPTVESARDRAAPLVADARDRTAPMVEGARDRLTHEVLPALVALAAAAGEATEDVRGETAKRGKAAVAALKGEVEPPKETHRLRNLLVLLGLGGLLAFAAKKLAERPATTTWQTPTGPLSTGTTTAGSHRAEPADDRGGASPDVVAADEAAEPGPVTTPDNPAETVDVSKK